MSKINNKIVDFDKLSHQLRCPSGEGVEEMADNMFESNSNMIRQTIKHLQLSSNTQIQMLEIGFANGKHVPYLIAQAKNNLTDINYQGVDISSDMVDEATSNNLESVVNNQTTFKLVFEDKPLHFDSTIFDMCFTVNTIYFWKNPQVYIQEIYNLLKENGQFHITFIEKEFSEKLPLNKSIFNFYHTDEVVEFMKQAGFSEVKVHALTEEATSKFGGVITRPFFIVSAVK